MAEVPASENSFKWGEQVGFYAGIASFLVAALSRFTALEVFVAVVAFYSFLLVLLFFLAGLSVQSLVSGAAIQYLALAALVMPFFGAFQSGFWAFIGLYSIAWWAFLFVVIEFERRISPRGEIDNTGPWALGDVPPILSSAGVWSPIHHTREIGREEAIQRRADHRVLEGS
jgi:hypothetical protein